MKTEMERSESAQLVLQRSPFRAAARRIWRTLGAIALVAAIASTGVLPAGGMRIRPLHDRILVPPSLVAATDPQGIVVVLIFTMVVEVDPHGAAHGVMRIGMPQAEPKTYEPIEALVARDEDQEATELLIFVTPRIVKEPTEASMVHVHRDLAGRDVLRWTLVDPEGNQLMFSTPGVIETLPPANAPPIRR